MAQGRMLLRKISKNDQVPRLIEAVDADLGAPHGAYAALMFTWCIAHLDVEGRMHGDPRLVRADVFPLMDSITTAHVERYLTHMNACDLAIWYSAGGRKYLAFPGFDENQPGLRKEKEHESDIPPPEQGDSGAGGAQAPSWRTKGADDTPERKGKEEKGKEENAPLTLIADEPPAEAGPDLGEPDNAAQRRTVDQWLAPALEVFAHVVEARKRSIPNATTIRPSYTALSHIADRLKSGKSVAECLVVVGNCEAESRARPESRRYFNAITPFRPENFERIFAMDEKTASATSKPRASPSSDSRPQPKEFTGHRFRDEEP